MGLATSAPGWNRPWPRLHNISGQEGEECGSPSSRGVDRWPNPASPDYLRSSRAQRVPVRQVHKGVNRESTRASFFPEDVVLQHRRRRAALGAGPGTPPGPGPNHGRRRLNQADDSEDYWELVKAQFTFVPGLYYFNNASLGPSPELVADATENFRRTLDGFPSKYMWGGWNTDKEQVREKAAQAVGASAEEIALIHNTTEGMNVIAASMDLEPGDEVILADHEHTSGTIPWKYWQETKGIKLVRPTLPMMPASPGELVDVYREAITPRTKVISMCHMVNTNGMILPVREVVGAGPPQEHPGGRGWCPDRRHVPLRSP